MACCDVPFYSSQVYQTEIGFDVAWPGFEVAWPGFDVAWLGFDVAWLHFDFVANEVFVARHPSY